METNDERGTLSYSMVCCQADNCTADLTDARRYHRRHKVCEFHAKAPVVIVAGLQQRFCQQCSFMSCRSLMIRKGAVASDWLDITSVGGGFHLRFKEKAQIEEAKQMIFQSIPIKSVSDHCDL